MRLLLVHNTYQQPGGEDQVFGSELELLASHGHEVLRYTAHNDAVRRLSKLNMAFRTTWSRTTYREMREILRREQPQIVHVHNTLPLLSPAVYYAAGAVHVPVVQTLHNYRLVCPKALLLRDQRICEQCLGRLLPWPAIVHACYRESRSATSAVAVMLSLHRLLGTWTRQVHRYIALTEFMRQKFIAGGLPAEQIVVKPNFVSPDPGVGNHRGRFALFVGRLSPEKGVHTLLRACTHLAGRIPVRIVGDGPLRDLVQGSAPGVEWLGRLDRQSAVALMKEATVLAFPSEWYEGFPVTIAEAFATGLPVVASELGAMVEIVADRRTGLLFEPGDAFDLAAKIEWAFRHPAEIKQMAHHARAEYEAKYTAERNYQLLHEIYESVLERVRPAVLRHCDSSVEASSKLKVIPGEGPRRTETTSGAHANPAPHYKDFPPGWGHVKIPVSSRRAALAGLALYTPSRRWAVWAQQVTRACIAILGPTALPGRTFPWVPVSGAAWVELSDAWRRIVGAFDDVAGYHRLEASRTGLALLLLQRGSPLGFVKVRQGDCGQLSNERRALDAVSSYRPRTFQVPEPLHLGSADGWHYLLAAPLPCGLHSPPDHPPLRAILEEIEGALAGLPRPLDTPSHWRPMHGDFTPWNLRQLRGGALVLIDWECAGWGPPGADEVLYRATWAAVRHRPPGRCDAREAMRFWRDRLLESPENLRDQRLAQALRKILGRMEER